ncbi:MAG: peptide deformylase [Rickettsiales bacterium]|nr:peptide deformylase [Rickettsiales bacterium]
MSSLRLVYAPNPIFKKKAAHVDQVDDEVRLILDQMLELLYQKDAAGIGANMVGVLKRLIVVDIHENDTPTPYKMINPEITWRTDTMQSFKEASLCYPGISADIERPDSIKLTYLDVDGTQKELEAHGWLATVIQHEIDYLDGKVFLDYLSPLKRNMLLKKMKKHMKLYPSED